MQELPPLHQGRDHGSSVPSVDNLPTPTSSRSRELRTPPPPPLTAERRFCTCTAPRPRRTDLSCAPSGARSCAPTEPPALSAASSSATSLLAPSPPLLA